MTKSSQMSIGMWTEMLKTEQKAISCWLSL